MDHSPCWRIDAYCFWVGYLWGGDGGDLGGGDGEDLGGGDGGDLGGGGIEIGKKSN